MISEKKEKVTINLLLVITFFFGMSMSSIDPLIPIISSTLKIGYNKIGVILFFGIFFMLIGTIIVATFSKKSDTKKLILISILLISAGIFLFISHLNIIIFIVFILIIRLGFGMIDNSTYTYVSQLFYNKKTITFIKMNLLWYVGATIGPFLISLQLFFKLNFKYSFIFIASALFILLILFYIITPSRNIKKVDFKNDIKNLTDGNILTNGNIISNKKIFLLIIKNPIIIVSGFLLFFLAGTVTSLSTWLTTYFLSFGTEVLISSSILSIYWLSSIIGLLIIKKLIQKIKDIKLIFWCLLLSVIFLCCFVFFDLLYLKIIFLVLQGITVAGIFPLMKAIPLEENPEFSGPILGFALTAQGLGMMVTQPIIGYVAQYYGGNNIIYIILSTLAMGFLSVCILYYLKTFRALKN